MTKSYKSILSMLALAFVLILGACSQNITEDDEDNGHAHDTSGETPSDMTAAKDPKFKDGEEVIVKTDHMPGMENAEGTVVKSFDTTAYVVTYTPTNGDEKVENHKWVVQEEIKDAGSEEFKMGDEVVLEADHMEGMKGAEARIEDSENTVVYMIDYVPNDEDDMTMSDQMVKNHKWVTEDELEAK